VGTRHGLDEVAEGRKSLHRSCWELNPSSPACGLVTILTELPQILKKIWADSNLIFQKHWQGSGICEVMDTMSGSNRHSQWINYQANS
jgi:hypothetical protein